MKYQIERMIRKALEIKGMSVSDFAKHLGVSRVTIYNLFEGQFSRKLLQQVSEFLEIPVHVLLMDDPEGVQAFDQKLVQAYRSSPVETRHVVSRLLGVDSGAGQTKPRILVVDDIKENVELLVRTLRKDFEVREYTDPLKALAALEKEDFDAVLTDQRMPGMTGTKLLSEVSKMEKPILKCIVSGYTDVQGFMEAINAARADAFFVKPFKPNEIRERLSAMLDGTAYSH